MPEQPPDQSYEGYWRRRMRQKAQESKVAKPAAVSVRGTPTQSQPSVPPEQDYEGSWRSTMRQRLKKSK